MNPWLLWLPLALTGASAPPFPTGDAPGDVMPARGWDVTHLQLQVDIDIDNKRIVGRTTHSIQPLARPSGHLRLHQVGLQITTVTVDGTPAQFVTGTDWLDVTVTPGAAHDVVVEYTAEPELGLHFRRPGHDSATVREVWTQGEGEDHRYWFPSWDHPSDKFTVAVDVTVDDTLTAVANGLLKDKQEAGNGRTTWSYALDQPIVNYLVAIAAGDYRQVDFTAVDGQAPRVPMSALGRKDLPEGALGLGLDRAVPMLAWFDQTLGTPYPYPTYRQVAVQGFMYGGMENASTTILADWVLPEEPWDDVRGTESIVAHELAHQWFGDLLTCYGWRELWLNEGFASYWTHRWMEHAYGDAYAAARWRGSYHAALNQPYPLALRSWSPGGADAPPSTNVYNRGGGVLRMVEVYLGRETFDAGIQRYVALNQDRLVETDDLRRAMEDVSGEHLGWLFDGWVHRAGTPAVTVTHRSAPGEDGGSTLTVTLRQKEVEGQAPWRAPVQVEVGTASGVARHQVWLGGGETQLVLDLDEDALWVLADPDHGVIATWDQTLSAAEWRAALAGSESWHARLTAVHALRKTEGGADDVAALRAIIEDDSLDRAVRAQAADSLGHRHDEAAVEALIALIDHPLSEVRQEVARGLGRQTPGPELAAVLERLAARDPHAKVRESALRALASLDGDRAARRAPAALRDVRPVRDAALTVLAHHGNAKVERSLISALGTREPRSTRQAAAMGLWSLIGRYPDEDGLRTRASRALERLLDSDDIRVRELSVRVLGHIGDEPAARRLQAFASDTAVLDLRDAARDAARDIRTRGSKPTEAPAKDDLERLRERLDALEAQLHDLERRP